MTWDRIGRGGWHVNAVPMPRWNQVIAAVDRLDGRAHTVVQLESRTPGVTMELMRSGDRYLCTHQVEMGVGVVLAEGASRGGSDNVKFRWGDREYVFPTRCGVPKTLALPALRWFFDSGEQAPALRWEPVSAEIASRWRHP